MPIERWVMGGLMSVAGLAASEAAYWWLAGGRASPDPPPAAACLQASPAQPSAPVAANAPRLLTGAVEQPDVYPNGTGHTAAAAGIDTTPAQMPDETTAERQARMNEQFMQGILDGPRSTALAQAIASGEPSVPDGTTVDDVRCRGAVCRIRARYGSVQAAQDFIDALAQRAEIRGQRLAVMYPEDVESPSTLIYVGEFEAGD